MTAMSDTGPRDWYAVPAGEAVRLLGSSAESGLDEMEAAGRLEKYGRNVLPEPEKPGLLRRFLRQLNNVLIYVLLAAAGITFFLGHYPDTIVILLVVLINALIGFIQENRAEAALDSIKEILAPEAHVIRGGVRRDIPADELVPGDIVRLKPGDKIPADMRLVAAASLRIEEAALTGEAEPAEKDTAPAAAGTPLGDRSGMAFSGTSVSAGTGLGLVTGTGKETEIGGISTMLADAEPPVTPLIRQMNRLSTVVSVFILILSAAVFAFGWLYRDYDPAVLSLSVIGLAIAAIPEGLPAIMSIILAIGVQSMARRCAIVRNLPSVETLGSVSVICSDKTGTLTKNEMTVTDIVTAKAGYQVTGTGYSPEGTVEQAGRPVTAADDPLLCRTLACFRIANESEIARDGNRWLVRGEPTEGALVTAAAKARLDTAGTDRLAVLPFDSEYKYMAVLARTGGGEVIYIKGAPDRLLEMAASEETENGVRPLDRAFWHGEVTRLARTGRRTIAAAYRRAEPGTEKLDHGMLRDEIVFLGLAAIVDPPREEAVAAVRECQDAGITVKMITGDHLETALAVGSVIGIGDGRHGLQGRDLDAMSEPELQNAVRNFDIFARTSPRNKLQLVKALKANGLISAMTGDGVNDAPALKTADVGIAMGIKGTEVTKEAAEIVLADDNFSTIAAAVEEGRKVYDNLKKTILFVLPTNGAECFLIMASILFGTILPLTPIQILWVNMVTSVTVSMALAFEPLDPHVMTQPPRDPAAPLLSGYFLWRIFYVSVLIGGACLLLSVELSERNRLGDALVRTITMNAIVLCQVFHLFNNRSLRRSVFCCDFFSNRAIFIVSALAVLLQLAITYLPFMNRVFGTEPLAFRHWILPVLIGLAVFGIVEAEKWIMRKADARRAGAPKNPPLAPARPVRTAAPQPASGS